MPSTAEPALRLPYPGLRSFQRDESDLFFGREGTVNEMINRLRPNHFLAVLGTSGSGKSSLVRIGLLDGLELGLLAEAGSRWRIADFAPGANPLRNLARELARLGGGSDLDTDFLEAFLARGPRSVVEWCKDGNLPKGANLLLLVDQFEELFRYQDYAERQAAEAFVALLIESARNREVPIYVVITMRSEYLGACALIDGLAEIINDGQFLTPRFNRDQCRDAVVGPAAVCGTTIEAPLVNRLLNDLEDFAPWDDRDSSDQLDRLVRRADQLPLLQHTLNRLWLRADAARVDKAEPIVLRLSDYDAIGGLRGAINAHADEILASLGPGLQSRAEQVFRALTDGKSLATAVRRPLRFAELVAVCDGDKKGVRTIVDAFRETGVNFLRPDTSEPLAADTIVDISHESLIRQWRRLSTWVVDEAREAQEWTRLGEAAARYRAGEGSLFHGQDLHLWREHPRPTAAWAKRYNQPYEETLAFLDESVGADRRGRRFRFAAIAAGLIVVVGFGGGGFFFTQLAGKNAELTEQATVLAAQQAQLTTANEALVSTSAELETNNAALVVAQAELAQSVDRLQAAQAELRNVFLGSFDASVGAYQHGGRWAEAGALLGAMLDRTSHGVGAERTYDADVVDAARMRLAEQWAFPVWEERTPGGVLIGPDPGIAPPGRYALSQDDATSSVRIVDLLTGGVLAETRLPEGVLPDSGAIHFTSRDGGDAAIVADSGNVFHWKARDDEIVDQGPFGAFGSDVVAIALDPATGTTAILLNEEDSELIVLADGMVDPILRAPLAAIPGVEEESDDPEAGLTTPDADGVAFWAGDPVVSFRQGDRRRFAVIDVEDTSATLLPATLTAAMPSPDGRWLFVEDTAGCEYDPTLVLVDRDGWLREPPLDPEVTGGLTRIPPTCLGVLVSPDDAVEVFGTVDPSSGDSSMIVDVRVDGSFDGAARYRLVIDGSEPAANPVLLAIGLVENDGHLVQVPTSEAGAEPATAPLVVGGGSALARFSQATSVDAWQPLPQFAPAATISWFDPVSETNVRLAEALVSPAGSFPALAVRQIVATWPTEKLGPFAALNIAVGANALLVVSGNQAAIQALNGDATEQVLRDVTFGRECRLRSGEMLDVTRLLSWSQDTPIFFGLDSGGRVLKFSAPEGSGAAVVVNCIGRLRADFSAIVVADPSRDQVLLQTDPTSFATLASNIATEKEFNEAPKFTLAVPMILAALLPGEAPALATIDRGGNLTVLRADPEWQVVSESRSAVVAGPREASATGDRLLVVGEAGRAVVVDLSTGDLSPVAAGVVAYSPSGYRLLPDGQTAELLLAGSLWQVPLPALPDLDQLARFAEAAAGALADFSDQDQVSLGERLTRRDDETMGAADASGMALGSDALCYLAANAVLEAWKAEAGQGAPGARLDAAREEANARCIGDRPLALVGRRLAAASHYVSPALDPWPVEWSSLLHDSIAGNRLASRAVLVGLSNSADPFADAAGEWFAASRPAFGLEVPESVLEEAASGAAIDPALAEVVAAQGESYEPAIHELLAHIAARSGGDPSRLRDAWVHFRIAEILYGHQVGRGAEADRTAELRATLARALPADALLAAWNEAGNWTADIDTLPTGGMAAPAESVRERLRADAERLAELETGEVGDDAPYRLLQAYLWLNLADLESVEAPDAAPLSYRRFAEILTSLPPSAELSPSLATALADAGLRVVELAYAGRFVDPETAAQLAPFIFGLAEPDEEGVWDAASLRAYATMVEGGVAIASIDPDSIPADVLDRLRFAERRFGHGFRVEDDDTRAAATEALEARLGFIDLLLARDPSRWDWLAAKGTTEFWIGYRLHDGDPDARTASLADAIRDLSAASDMAARGFPAESRYWLTEARRWLPLGEDPAFYLDLTVDGIDDYAVLRDLHDSGDWIGPLDAGELLASNTELLAKIADQQANLIFVRGDDWSLDDPLVHRQVLDALSYLAEWDRIRALAVDAGSTWSSMHAGYPIAPGYLLATVGGRFNVDRSEADDCDRAAAFTGDPVRRAPAVAFDQIDSDPGIAVCTALLNADHDNPRLNFLLARLLWGTANIPDLALSMLQIAADGEYAVAFNSLAGYLEEPSADSIPDVSVLHLDMRSAYAQRVVRAVFADVHGWLAPLAVTSAHRAGLRWLIERAAALGSPDAHIALADLPETSGEDRAYHLEVAAVLLDEIDELRAEEIRDQIPPEDYVDAADRAEDEWRVEQLVELPPDLVDQLKAATN